MSDFETYYNNLKSQVSSGSVAAGGDDGFSKFYEGLKMDIGSIPDTRPKQPTFAEKLQSGALPNMDIMQSPLMKEVHAAQTVPSQPSIDQSRQLPVIGPVLKGLDWFAKTPVQHVIADIGQMFYTPGAGLANIEGLAGSAETAVARLLPGLGNSAVGKIAQKALSEGIVGAPLVGGQSLMTNPDESFGEFLKQAALGAGMGAGLGAAGKGIQVASSAARAALTQAEQKASLGTAVQDFMNRTKATGEVPFDAAAQSRNVQAAPGGFVNPADQAANRFGFIDQRTNTDRLSLPPSNREVRMNEAQQRGTLPTGSDPIAAPGDIHTYALPEPKVSPATSARIEQRPNIYRQKLENLVNAANQMDHPPGRELESLDSLWSQMASKEDPSLNELIDLAYPKSKVTASSLIRAREGQYARDVAGVSGPVKSMGDRYNGGAVADAAAPRERLQGIRQDPPVEIIPPQRKFAPVPESTMPITSVPKGEAAGNGTVRRASKSVKAKSKPIIDQNFTAADLQAGDASQNYTGNIIPFRQAATQSERTINRNQVVRNIKKNLGVVIDTGKLKRINKNGKIVPAQAGTLGQYKISPEVVRTRMAEDLQVISHEIGHHLDKKHDLQDTRFASEYKKILQNNPVLNVGAYQPHQLPAEAVAEYVRLRLTDPAKARQLAPNFTAHFDSKVPAKVLNGLEASQRDINTWITQGDYNQAKGLIDFESGNKKEPFSRDKTYTRFVDDLNPLKLAEKALNGAVGIGKDSIYKMARLSRGIAERAKLAVTSGIYDEQGNKVVDGLREIVKPLEDLGVKEKDFATYLAVKHAIDLKKLGKQVPFDDAQIRAVMGKLDIPEVQAVQKEIIKYNNALLDELVNAQILSSKAVSEMRTKYPNYVPLMRYFDEDAIAGFKNGGFGAAKGFANITNPIKAMSEEGSTRTIINPIESMVKNTFLIMNAAAKNKVGLQLSELAKIDGAGAWVEHIGPGGRDPKDHVIAVWENGEKQSYKIREPELYNAMLSLDNESTNSLIKFLGGSASLLRAGATLTPEFTIRNAMRDIIGATINSTKYGFNPLDFFEGLFHVVGKTKTFDQFISSGAAMGTMQALDRDASREALKAVFKLSMKDKFMKVVTSERVLANLISEYNPIKPVIGGLRKAAEVSELSTKVGAFNKALKKSGSLEEAAYTAKDLMDFNRAGSSVRQANRAVAFLNAQIQGVDRMARAFKDNKAGFLIRAFTTLVLPAVGLHYWIHNLPEDKKKIYDNIPQWQKDSFFIIPGPGDTFFRIPKPFEAGMLFATGTERTLRWLADNDPDAYKQYGSSVLSALTPPVMFSALTPLLEATTNHSFFKDAPIVPQGEQNLEKKDQYGLFTSETAKQAGNLISMIPGLSDSNAASPRIIDNTIKGYTAGLGQYGVQGVDALINAITGDNGPPKPAKKWNEQPPISSLLATTSGGGQVRQDFYDKWDELTKSKNSADRNQVAFTDPEYGRMKGAYNTITQLNKRYKLIQKSRDISAQDKRSQLDALDGRMNDIAAKALGK